MMKLPLGLSEITGTIEEIEIFLFQVDTPRHFSNALWKNRQHAFLSIKSNEKNGLGENIISVNDPGIDLEKWGRYFLEVKGLTVSEALKFVLSKMSSWGAKPVEMVETALIDLAGKLIGMPALQLLGLDQNNRVPGLYCILEENPKMVMEKANVALSHGYKTHIKVKLFGNREQDISIIKAARKVIGNDAFLIGDVNTGYRTEFSFEPVDDLAEILKQLYRNGLSACEDPAFLSDNQWICLQEKTGDLALIPDYPMRSSREAILNIQNGMGKYYNIHPGSAGSLIDAVNLSHKIRKFPSKIMIGDDSLIGPACTAWQHIAIGVGAAWVEAMEKPDESDKFLDCIISSAVGKSEEMNIYIKEDRPGFGLDVDMDRLSKIADKIWRV